MGALPLGEGCVLVVKAEVASRNPPLQRTSDSGSVTPTVGIAAALATVRVVEPVEKRVRHREGAYRDSVVHINYG